MGSRNSHPRRMPKAYAKLLAGCSDEEVLATGISQGQFELIKKFHSMITCGCSYMTLVMIRGIDQSIVKTMWLLYHDFIAGKDVCNEPPRIPHVFKMVLAGHGYDEIIDAGYNDTEIDSANRFLVMVKDGVKDRMLLSTIADIMSLPKASIQHMLSSYRDYEEGQRAEAQTAYHPDQAYKITQIAA